MYGDRPRVTPQEWQEYVRPHLSEQGFREVQIDKIQALFEQSFQVNPAMPDWKPGIDQAAMEQTMTYLKGHKDELMFDDHQLDLLQSELSKYIAERN